MNCDWSLRNSVLAVDAGSHLAAITRILVNDFPLVSGPQAHRNNSTVSVPSPGGDAFSDENDDSNTASDRSISPEPTVLLAGPFQGASFPHRSARANAVHFVREHVDAYLITHPHLDHISGFAINTAAFHNTLRPKKLSALPFTVNAIKHHIFNDVIWPNLTDEEDGVGFVTFQRLTEGGNLALGEGHSRGFIEVCNGLAVKAFKVSHGCCASAPKPDGRGSRDTLAAQAVQSQHTPHHPSHTHNRSMTHPHNTPSVTTLKVETPGGALDGGRRSSIFSQPSQPGTPTYFSGQDPLGHQPVVDSTAYFIRADHSGREILIFGDVEPDSISLSPRTYIVWSEAAPKIAAGLLLGIFIECSYNDSRPDRILFGHLAPRHLIAELQTLAEMVVDKKRELSEKAGKKRKRLSAHHTSTRTRSQRDSSSAPVYPNDEHMRDVPHEEGTPLPVYTDGKQESSSFPKDKNLPLKGVKVIVIHVKDSMTDGPLVGDSILQELRSHEVKLNAQGRPLGCTFEISKSGDSYFF
jgi:cAMP phosphodiesterase